MWGRAKLHVYLSCIRNRGAFCDGFTEELLWCSRWGRSISSHEFHVVTLRDSYIANSFPDGTYYWPRIEVPRVSAVELHVVFTYSSQEFRDHQSGW